MAEGGEMKGHGLLCFFLGKRSKQMRKRRIMCHACDDLSEMAGLGMHEMGHGVGPILLLLSSINCLL